MGEGGRGRREGGLQEESEQREKREQEIIRGGEIVAAQRMEYRRCGAEEGREMRS